MGFPRGVATDEGEGAGEAAAVGGGGNPIADGEIAEFAEKRRRAVGRECVALRRPKGIGGVGPIVGGAFEEGDGGFGVEGKGGAGGFGELGFAAAFPHVDGVEEGSAPSAEEGAGLEVVGVVRAAGGADAEGVEALFGLEGNEAALEARAVGRFNEQGFFNRCFGHGFNVGE